MRIITDLYYKNDRPTAIALGAFDGVHLGHRAVISAAAEAAHAASLESAVFTFSTLPKSTLPDGSRAWPLCSFKEKAALMEGLGVELLLAPAFSQELSRIGAEEFVRCILVGGLKARHIVCGYDHRFGAGGRGDAELLMRICREESVGVTVIPPVLRGGERVSSTKIRCLLEEGRIEDARLLLGHDL